MPKSVVQETANAVPDHVMRDIVAKGTIPGPSGAGASGQVSPVSTSPGIPGSGTGWVHETPIAPPPGIRYVDAQLDAQAAKDRQELITQKARDPRCRAKYPRRALPSLDLPSRRRRAPPRLAVD